MNEKATTERKEQNMSLTEKIHALGYYTELINSAVDFKIKTGIEAPNSVPKKLIRAFSGNYDNGKSSPWFTSWREVYNWAKNN